MLIKFKLRVRSKKLRVNVDSVRTMNYAGKKKVVYKAGVISGRKSRFKKAIVQLADDTIDFYSNI